MSVDLRLIIKDYLKKTRTEEKEFAKNCGTSLETLTKYLNGENVRYTTSRKYLLFLANIFKEAREVPPEFVKTVV